jgi:hypothetical protein
MSTGLGISSKRLHRGSPNRFFLPQGRITGPSPVCPHQKSEFAVPRFHENAKLSGDGKTGQKPRRFSSQVMGVASAPAITFFLY